jgi:hypothetical protein
LDILLLQLISVELDEFAYRLHFLALVYQHIAHAYLNLGDCDRQDDMQLAQLDNNDLAFINWKNIS